MSVIIRADFLPRAAELADHLHDTPCVCLYKFPGRMMAKCRACTRMIIAAAMTEVADPTMDEARFNKLPRPS